MCPGVEGSHSTAVTVVKLASGELALAVETESGGGGDCDEEFNTVSLLTWKEGKLIAWPLSQSTGPHASIESPRLTRLIPPAARPGCAARKATTLKGIPLSEIGQ